MAVAVEPQPIAYAASAAGAPAPSPTTSTAPPVWADAQTERFALRLSQYQGGKRCRAREDLLSTSLGGLAIGALSGFVVGGVAGLPLLVVGGLVTGAVGAAAGGAIGGAAGVVGGGVFAACHVHCHTPDPGNLRKHVFSHFKIVPMRHQSSRIIKKLVQHQVLYENDVRRVINLDQQVLDGALDEVRVFGRRLTDKQRGRIRNILYVQAVNTQAYDAL